MLYRAASILLLIVSLNLVWGIPSVNMAILGLFIIWTGVSLRGMASMQSQVFGRVYWRGDPSVKAVALSFDDGPSEPYTGRVLDVLDAHGVKATFFVIGDNVRKNPALVKRMVDAGHELGNHSQTHPWVFKMLFRTIREDIEQCQREIEKAAGYRPGFFRQPVGLNNPSVMKVLENTGMSMVGWQCRAYDGFRVSREKVAARILGGVRPGGIILLHDGCDGVLDCDRTPTIEALGDIIPALKSRGYEFRTVSGLVGVENRQNIS